MQYLVYLIAAYFLLRLIPYIFIFQQSLRMTLQSARFERRSSEEVPTYLRELVQIPIAELEQMGFRVCGYWQVQRTLRLGSQRDWEIVLEHDTFQAFAKVGVNVLVDPADLFRTDFFTFFDDGTLLFTMNDNADGVLGEIPNTIVQDPYTDRTEVQWQVHRDLLHQLAATKQPSSLTSAAFLEALQANINAYMDSLVESHQIMPIPATELFRLSWVAALRRSLKVGRGIRKSAAIAKRRSQHSRTAPAIPIELEVEGFQRIEQLRQGRPIQPKVRNWLLLGSLALFVTCYTPLFKPQTLPIFIGALLLHEAGHVLAAKRFGYRGQVVFFVPFLGALATGHKEDATLAEKIWVLLAGPLPGLLLGIGLAIAGTLSGGSLTTSSNYPEWFPEAGWILIALNLFNLLPIYPLDGGQIADLLLFSQNPYTAVIFKVIGVLILGLIGLIKPVFLMFAALIALTIPTSFRTAKLTAKLRKEISQVAGDDRDTLLHVIFQTIKQAGYGSLLIAKQHTLAISLLQSHREIHAKWTTRVGLSTVYLVSLIGGIAGVLYAMVPDWSYWAGLANIYLENPSVVYQQKLKQEIESANKALSVNPRDVNAYFKRGQAHWRLNDKQAAIADYDRAIHIDPKNPDVYFKRAAFRNQLRNSEGAIADYNQVLKLTPNNTDAYFKRAGTYSSLQNYLQAIKDYDQIVRLEPQNISAYLSRGYTRQRLQDYQGSIKDYEQVLRLDPQNLSAYFGCAEAYYQLKDYRSAIADANQIIQLEPDLADAYELRSKARRSLGDETGAIADQQKADTLSQSEEDKEN